MTQNEQTTAETKNPLVAAQKIVAELQGMTPDNQSLAVQFAMQTLRLTPLGAYPAATLAPAQPHTPHANAAAIAQVQPTDIKQFAAAKSPQSDNQFAAVVAYFYQFEAPGSQRRETVDAATMKEAARLAGRKQVKDWNKTLNNATGAGYLDRAERGSFKLSSVGENLVAITLPGTVWGGASSGGSPGKKAAKKNATHKKTTKKSG